MSQKCRNSGNIKGFKMSGSGHKFFVCGKLQRKLAENYVKRANEK